MSDVNSPWPNAATPPPGSPSGDSDVAPTADGATIALSAFAIVGVLVAIVALWLSRCDVSVLDRLVSSLPGAMIRIML